MIVAYKTYKCCPSFPPSERLQMNDLKTLGPSPSLEKSLVQFVNDLEVATVPMLLREQLNTQVSSLKKLLFQASKNRAEENRRVAIEETKAAVRNAVAQVMSEGVVKRTKCRSGRQDQSHKCVYMC